MRPGPHRVRSARPALRRAGAPVVACGWRRDGLGAGRQPGQPLGPGHRHPLVLSRQQQRPPVPTEKPTAESIRGYLRGFARFLPRDPAGKVLLALIAEAQHDPDTAKSFHQRCLGPRRGQERDMLARGIDAGDVSPKLGLDATIDALVGPIVYCARTGSSIPRGLVDTLVEDLLRSRSH
ncbi:TetR-like C-terminal domain-containing protein [Streptomyces avermitilis]|uniref:TetR-like C-terminal domain-containing protein n=1 Tax=Streptomyces avermitilis TaxID=33903 RepID=UPI0038015AC9